MATKRLYWFQHHSTRGDIWNATTGDTSDATRDRLARMGYATRVTDVVPEGEPTEAEKDLVRAYTPTLFSEVR
jgi:hypothetical protein